jgi:alkylation response protein AidB-like acyl-CoA dehydrogenase
VSSPPLPELAPDFGFTEEHGMLRQSARRFLSQRFDTSALREFHNAPHDESNHAALHREIAALGWTALTVPENSGGSGLGWLHAALLNLELGRALLPLPTMSCMLAAEALSLSENTSHLAGIANGDTVATIALTQDHGLYDVDAIEATARETGGAYELNGTFAEVAAITQADLVIAPFRIGDSHAWFAVPLSRDGVSIQADKVVDPTRPTGQVAFEGTLGARVDRLACDSADMYQAMLLRGLVLVAADSIGAAEAAFAMTRDYAIERKQFGRPIGTYQAVSHPIVNCMIAIEQATTLTVAAAAALDEGATLQEVELLARMANAAACDALWNTTSRGVQTHGGFGFTWDCDMHFFFRRALANRGALGDPHFQRQLLAERLFA